MHHFRLGFRLFFSSAYAIFGGINFDPIKYCFWLNTVVSIELLDLFVSLPTSDLGLPKISRFFPPQSNNNGVGDKTKENGSSRQPTPLPPYRT